MSLTDRTLRGGAWQLLTVVAEAMMQLVVLATLARFILPGEFGLIAIAGIATSFVHLFSEMGMGPALVQRKEISSSHIRVAFTSSMLLGAAVFFLLWALAGPMAVFFRQAEIADILPVIGLSLPISSFGLPAHALLKRKLEFKKLSWATLGSYFFGFAPVGIVMAVLGYGAWALVYAILAQSSLRSITLFLLSPHSMKPSFAAREFRELFTFGGGHTLSKLFRFCALKGDYFVVGRFLGAETLGLYERIFRVMQLPGQYLAHVLEVLFPAMSRIQNQPTRLAKVYFAGIAIINTILLPASGLLIILAPELVLILLGPNWIEAVLPLQILLTGISLRISAGMSDSLSRATGAVYRIAVRKAIYAFAVVMGSWIGHFWGIVGVAIGVSGALLIHYIMMAHLSLSIIKVGWLRFFKEHLSGLSLGAITLATSVPTVNFLRHFFDSSFFIFGFTILMVGTGMCAIIMAFPQLLGSSSLWAIDLILRESPLKTLRISRFLIMRFSQR